MPNNAPLWFDTVAISNFAFGDALSWLMRRYPGRVYVPTQVLDEIAVGVMRGRTALSAVSMCVADGSIGIVTLSAEEHLRFTAHRAHLGSGEAACIAVAERRGGTVVTDDKAARTAAAVPKVAVTGTVGILLAGVNSGALTGNEADALLTKMVAAGFYAPVRRISDLIGSGTGR